jgi:thymidylate synthase
MNSYHTFSEAYPYLIKDVLENGVKGVSPRGMGTRELTGYQFKIESLEDSIPRQAARKLNYRFALLEGLLNVWGNYPEDIVLYVNKNMQRFQNEDTKMWDGAYAPRLHSGYRAIIELLKHDPDTREAVLPIFKLEDLDIAQISKDTPCTLTLQLLIRDGKLNMIATMRSNDIYWGTAYDVPQFMMVQRAVACILGIPTGWYIHQAGSLHAYDDKISEMEAIFSPEEKDRMMDTSMFPTEWPHMEYSDIRWQLDRMFAAISNFIVSGEHDPFILPLPEPFNTYYWYLTKDKKVKEIVTELNGE